MGARIPAGSGRPVRGTAVSVAPSSASAASSPASIPGHPERRPPCPSARRSSRPLSRRRHPGRWRRPRLSGRPHPNDATIASAIPTMPPTRMRPSIGDNCLTQYSSGARAYSASGRERLAMTERHGHAASFVRKRRARRRVFVESSLALTLQKPGGAMQRKSLAWQLRPSSSFRCGRRGRARRTRAPPSLSSAAFALTLSRTTPSGTSTALTSDELATYFSIARCACPTSVVVGLTLSSDAAATLAAADTVEAQIVVGSDCDIVTATACPSLGTTLTLSASKLATTQSLTTAAVFSAAGQTTCTAASASSTRLWAIVRLDGQRASRREPSLRDHAGRRRARGADGREAAVGRRRACSCRGLRPATRRRCRGIRWSAHRGPRPRPPPATTRARRRRPMAAPARSRRWTRSSSARELRRAPPERTLVCASTGLEEMAAGLRDRLRRRRRHRRHAERAVGTREGTPAPTVGLEDALSARGWDGEGQLRRGRRGGAPVAGACSSRSWPARARWSLLGARAASGAAWSCSSSPWPWLSSCRLARGARRRTTVRPFSLAAFDDAPAGGVAARLEPRAALRSLPSGHRRRSSAARGVAGPPVRSSSSVSSSAHDRSSSSIGGSCAAPAERGPLGLGVGYYHVAAAALERRSEDAVR